MHRGAFHFFWTRLVCWNTPALCTLSTKTSANCPRATGRRSINMRGRPCVWKYIRVRRSTRAAGAILDSKRVYSTDFRSHFTTSFSLYRTSRQGFIRTDTSTRGSVLNKLQFLVESGIFLVQKGSFCLCIVGRGVIVSFWRRVLSKTD